MKKRSGITVTDNFRPKILGMSIDPTSYYAACDKILGWAASGESRTACFANVHMIMTAYDSPNFKARLNQADMVTPDGMPLVWTLRRMGYPDQGRVYGPTLTMKLLPALEKAGIPIGFFGSTPKVLEKLQHNIRTRHPEINIVCAISPPFRQMDESENQSIIKAINRSGARVLFVGLGCPKQEIWMHENRNKVQSVMLGVGAAFDFIAGVKPQAPLWIQRLGLEWFYRLLSEPKRLWKRYVYYNPRFIVAVTRQLLAIGSKNRKQRE